MQWREGETVTRKQGRHSLRNVAVRGNRQPGENWFLFRNKFVPGNECISRRH